MPYTSRSKRRALRRSCQSGQISELTFEMIVGIVEEVAIQFPEVKERKINLIKAIRDGVGCSVKEAIEAVVEGITLSEQKEYESMDARNLEKYLAEDTDKTFEVLSYLTNKSA